MNPFSFLQNARAGALRIATLALGAASLSACAYGYGDYGGYGGVSVGVGSGYAGGFDPYCDGFSAWDSWYGCDYGYGFGQIGFGGGYWDNFYYPGYGTWIYDRPGGRRFAMQDRHRRYWGQQRWQYYQQRRGDRRDFRGDGRDWRRDRRETLDDRRDWRREQQADNPEFPRTRRGERERMRGMTPEDRQRQLERWQQRQQERLGQPQGDGQRWQGDGRNWQGRGDGQTRGNREGRGEWRGGGEGRERPQMRQPQPGFTPPARIDRPQRPERAPQAIERPVPRGRVGEEGRGGVQMQDVRED